MAERLTKKDKPILKNQLEDNMSVNESTAIKRLWQYENIMGKYNVEDLDQLDIMLFCLSSETKFQLKQLQKLYKKYKIKNVEELDKKLADANTWKRACELACKWFKQTGFIGDQTEVDYYYQQAKTEGNDE